MNDLTALLDCSPASILALVSFSVNKLYAFKQSRNWDLFVTKKTADIVVASSRNTLKYEAFPIDGIEIFSDMSVCVGSNLFVCLFAVTLIGARFNFDSMHGVH